MYTPDRGFVKKLKALNKRLIVRWESRIERWVVYEKIKQKVFCGEYDGIPLFTVKDIDSYVMIVDNEDRSYRPLDNRTIMWLKYNDLHRSPDVAREKLEKFDKQDKAVEKQGMDKAKETAEEFADFATFYRFGDPRETKLKEYV